MNLAIPALVTILGILPGIVFFGSYLSGRFPRRLATISPVAELAYYIGLAIPIDAAALGVIRWTGGNTNFDLIAGLLVGSQNPTLSVDLGQHLHDHWVYSSGTYLATLFVAWALGSLTRRVVWTFRLDTRFPFLRLKHDWYYTLQGRLADVPKGTAPYADILVNHPDGSQLYQGFLVAIEADREGGLQAVTLTQARRGHGRGEEFKWKDIRGARLVLVGSCIHSINMQYLVLQSDATTGHAPKWRERVYSTVRAFISQEP